MKKAIVIYWIWHLFVTVIAKSFIITDFFWIMTLLHLNYASLFFLIIYPMYEVYVYQEKVNRDLIWLFLASALVRAIVFHAQLYTQISLSSILMIYGFGLIIFIASEKAWTKVAMKLKI